MTDLERLAARLPVKRFTRREMFICAMKMRVRGAYELHWPIVYRYVRKIMNYIGVRL